MALSNVSHKSRPQTGHFGCCSKLETKVIKNKKNKTLKNMKILRFIVFSFLFVLN